MLQSFADTLGYCGPFEYENGSLSRVNFPGGYVSGGVAYHYILDHQGNVRQVVDATTGKVVQESHYYPGGMLFAESTATYFKPGSANNSYRYGGKEFLTSDGLNLYQFGARMYDPSLLRFITPDPLRNETPRLSSYLYCAANPVMLTDPTGMEITQEIDGVLYSYKTIGNQWGFYDSKGNLYTGDKSFAGDLDKIRNTDPILERMITNIVESETEVRLFYGDNNITIPVVDSQKKIYAYDIQYNPTKIIGGEAIAPDGTITNSRSPDVGLAHELGHVFDRMNPFSTYRVYKMHPNLIIKDKKGIHREAVSCIVENIYREAIGEPIRVSYKSIKQSAASRPYVPINTNIGYSIFDKLIMDIITNY